MCVAVCPKLETSAREGEAAEDANNIGKLKRECPQTGHVLSRLPEYLRSPQSTVGCSHGACLRKQTQWDELKENQDSADNARKAYVVAFAADASRIVQTAGVHAHTSSCYKYDSAKEKDGKPEHCRFGFVHFVKLWCWKQVVRRGKEMKVAVERVFARFGKEPVLPEGYEPSASEARSGIGASVAMFAAHHPGLGSRINPRNSSDRPGRINTVRLHPREP